MPRQRRWENKRLLEEAVGNINAAEGKIARVGDQFKGVHDDWYQAFQQVFVSCEMIIKSLNQLKDMM